MKIKKRGELDEVGGGEVVLWVRFVRLFLVF